MIRRCLFAGFASLAALPAQADPRIATHFFQPNEVVTIHGRGDTQSTIAFAADERIENVAVGDSAGWQVTPNKRADLLFLKPTRPGARTNMTVVTDQRTYLFDLIAAPREAAVYMLRFTYPAPPPAKPVAVETAAAAPVPPVVADPASLDPATLDFAWASKGDRALLPSRIFDDGRNTYLAWDKDAALPAILAPEAKGVEGPINYTVRGGYVVVEGVPAALVLRSGKRVATLMPGAAPKPADRKGDDPHAQSASAARPARGLVRPGPPYANFPILASREQ